MNLPNTKVARFKITLSLIGESIGLPPEYEITSLYMDTECPHTAIATITGFDLKEVKPGEIIPIVKVVCEKISAQIKYEEEI